MRRMRMRSSLPGTSSASTDSFVRSSSVSGSGGTGVGVGGSSNHSESRKEVGDRWRMLYYQVRLSQKEHQTLTTVEATSDSCKVRNIDMGVFNPLKWKMRTFAYVSVGILAFYMLFIFKKTHHVSFDGVIKNTKPKVVWEFVADFSNMMKLNPTIEKFNIVAESGNYEHWKYSAHYTEHLSHMPIIKNNAKSHFAVKPDGENFLISSYHQTCFFSSFGCLDSVSEFKFFSDGENTKYVETVQYECPIFFSALCNKEVMYQRQEIMKNLKTHFSTANIKS